MQHETFAPLCVPKQVAPTAEIDTKAVPAHERIDYWEARCRNNIVGFQCSTLSEQGLAARYRHYRFGALQMTDILGNDHVIDRTPAHVRRQEKDAIFLIALVKGPAFINRQNRCVLAQSGDLILYDTNTPYMHGFPGDMRQVIFEIPGAPFRKRFGNWDLREALRLDSTLAHSKTICQDLFTLNFDSPAASVETQIWDVVAAAYDLANGQMRTAYQSQIFKRIRRYITANLADPDLSPSSIATALGISVRQLNRLFSTEIHSVQRHIYAERLQRCKDELLQDHTNPVSISDIAFKWGFKSQAHFARKFREEFGGTPSEFRAAARQAA
ncbi:helix-turn-helix domain-containing protein [Cognatishimia sp. SS12]|uniref:helix-turn-helix domain-containing protein n=1 Tax=Cognatishimia sp. SS12 TaxID=2979465 RepID=UPI00232BC717|nr:helix-turn-helix domain-containing protein [Cognatishimia sp. SS12]MDC0739302.1 helix-turn-helix domain-containing protein [Cognatishimia sp. SS12]